MVRKVDTAGVVTTVAGTGVSGFACDRGPATLAQLDNPESIAVDREGNVFFDDTDYDPVRRIDPAGIITTIAGNGTITADGTIHDVWCHPKDALLPSGRRRCIPWCPDCLPDRCPNHGGRP